MSALRYRPELDGLRAVAAIAVVFDHAWIPYFDGGGLGVDLFFALSGFLITGLLVDEWERRGSVDLRRFWIRRALRLLPAMVALVAACAVLAPAIPGTSSGIVPTLLYFTNWTRAFSGDVGALGHTWSLAIEEQFYIVWPVVLLALLAFTGRRGALRLTIGAAVAVTLIREVAAGRLPLERIYNGTDFRLDGLLYGCALALWGGRARARIVPIAGGALLVGLFVARIFFGLPWLERTGIALGTCAVIAGIHLTPKALAVLSAGPLRWIGRRSYGVYLWHYPLCLLLAKEGDPGSIVLAVSSTFVVAAASYRWLEVPFLRLKDRRAVTVPALHLEGIPA